MLLCHQTFKPCPPPAGGCGASGYAVLNDTGEHICYEQADRLERLSLSRELQPGYVLSGYLSGDSKHITTWTGGKLLAVNHVRQSKRDWRGNTWFYVWARDHRGRQWYGRNGGWAGGPGCCINMRLLKH